MDPQERKIMQAMQDDSFSEEAFNAGYYNLTDKEKELAGQLPVSLVLNKVDLITNKKKLRSLQAELEDLCPFEDVFHISCESGYGLDHLRDYLIQSSV
jgi:GTPase Era involved in 16S rRNA processing